MNDWKDRLGVVFSTNQDYNYEYDEPQEQETLPPGQQKLRVTIEKKGRGGKVATIVKGFVGTDADRGKGRGGKVATIVKGFVGTDADRGKLEKMLKTKCGVGGSSKDGLIILQGDIRDKIIQLLRDLGYTNTK